MEDAFLTTLQGSLCGYRSTNDVKRSKQKTVNNRKEMPLKRTPNISSPDDGRFNKVLLCISFHLTLGRTRGGGGGVVGGGCHPSKAFFPMFLGLFIVSSCCLQ